MNVLEATYRNHTLRISFNDHWTMRSAAVDLHDEFLQLLEKSPRCEAVIIDLPNIPHLTSHFAGMLTVWRRMVCRMGAKFRLNGLSHLVSEFFETVGEDEFCTPSERPQKQWHGERLMAHRSRRIALSRQTRDSRLETAR